MPAHEFDERPRPDAALYRLLPGRDRAGADAADRASTWAQKHGWETGVAEMALGGALLAWGVESGAIELGQQLVASLFDDGVMEGVLGGVLSQ
ncbi:MAG: hypothetical protein JF606_28135 [Burkholderiales bacterium]|nr:hypothetical protein [Burkholderiales bacterium]